ncbi:MAG: nucleotidyltransferase domain-containing protein [Epsilonproteobacteria bacterium]|nr:nucleotidyltransferase domain-containing protein [Campylobacterota bacterium]PIP09285.1 MAG: DNA polymerase subunit beta [Sulfurimonas sp. CG23_combo_of_CG06-09_8_20_14_all_36_33]PIS25759.1 MAG: DNA polymerase subunit beta [Sulfurimonas sp. CG08_land_8_20_14_0_20_36_33]PIU34607.1 MAG: DNA polymerase subunit beta [Sulfurimonas sp. CG07_land_8_20_14_0_80_36_56]PIV04816.1 MAG: DNA polymerase subunit beta [Sulfurimonas sp. CG03_land_8_20_14_0_80_36_25]PIV36297.1 MAG: DNA polymerase subunit beta
MRLSKRIQNIIKKAVFENFGDVKVYLFGSRTDDTKKGGDIDIAIDTQIDKEEFRKKKIQFFVSLLRVDFDLKIDLVQMKHSHTLFSNELENSRLILK